MLSTRLKVFQTRICENGEQFLRYTPSTYHKYTAIINKLGSIIENVITSLGLTELAE